MLDFLRDAVWQFIGAFFGLVALIVSLVLFWAGHRRKELSYEVTYHASLATLRDGLEGDIEILYKGEPVPEVHLLGIRITNSGNVPILPENFVRPVTLTFGDNIRVLSARTARQNPDNLGAELELDAERGGVQLSPVLLNSGWGVTLSVVVSGLGELRVDGLIVGVRTIGDLVEKMERKWLIVSVIGILSLFGGFWGLMVSRLENAVLIFVAVILWVVSGVCLVFMARYKYRTESVDYSVQRRLRGKEQDS